VRRASEGDAGVALRKSEQIGIRRADQFVNSERFEQLIDPATRDFFRIIRRDDGFEFDKLAKPFDGVEMDAYVVPEQQIAPLAHLPRTPRAAQSTASVKRHQTPARRDIRLAARRRDWSVRTDQFNLIGVDSPQLEPAVGHMK